MKKSTPEDTLKRTNPRIHQGIGKYWKSKWVLRKEERVKFDGWKEELLQVVKGTITLQVPLPTTGPRLGPTKKLILPAQETVHSFLPAS